MRQMNAENSMQNIITANAAGIAWRVRFMPTDEKYTDTT